MQDLFFSIIFVGCQLLLLGLLFGLVLFRKPDPAKPPGKPIKVKTSLMAVAAGVVIVSAAVNIGRFQSQRQNATTAAWQGKPIVLRLDEEACLKFDLGAIGCKTDYLAQYGTFRNRWTVTGYSTSDGKVITGSADNADARPGNLSIWGALFLFDNQGTIFYRWNQKVGTIRLQS